MHPKKINALARIRGGNIYPDIDGVVHFREVDCGTQVSIEVYGLPMYRPGTEDMDPIGPLGFHVHEYGVCKISDPDSPFESAGGHFNPYDEPHGSIYSVSGY